MSYKMDFASNRLTLVGLTIAALLFSKGSFAKDYISSAEEYLREDNASAAMIELKNAIQASPEEALPRFMLGNIYLSQGQFANAEKELSRALKYGYSESEVLPLLARALLNQNKLADTLLLLEEFTRVDTSPPSDLLAIAAIAEIALNNLDGAKTFMDLAEQETVYTKLAEATYLAATDQKEAAYNKVKRLVDSDESNSDVWLLKGHLEITNKEFDTAYDSYKKALELTPMAPQYPFFMANALVYGKRFEEAQPIVDKLLQINNQNLYVNELKAVILFAEKNYPDAKIYADRAINNGANSLRAATISGVSAFQLGQFEQAHRVLTKISPRLPENHIVNRLYHITQLKLGYLDEAIDSLNSYDIETQEDSAFISRASMELAKIGRSDSALKLAQKASVNNNSQAEATLGLIKLANDDLTGIEDLQSALADNPSLPGAKRALVNYYLLRKEFDEAEAIADKWIKDQPEDIDGLIVKGIVSKEKGSLDVAKQYYNQVRTLAPNNTQAIVELARIESATNNADEALSLLLAAKRLSPSDHKVNKRFLEYSQQLNRLPEAIQVIDEQIETEPFNRHLQIQKAYALELNGDKQSAIKILESLPHADKDAAVWKLLGNLHYSLGDLAEAKRSYQQWLGMAQYDPTAYIGNIQLAQRSDDTNEALKLVKRAQVIFPDDPRFSLMKAELLFKRGELTAAQRELERLPKEIQDTANFLRLQGIIYINKQDFSSAVEVYKKRYQIKPTILTARELADAYSLNGQQDQAINFINDLISEYGKSVWPLKLKLAELYIDSQPNKAIEEYKSVLENHPDNALALNNLAWLYLYKEQPEKACEFAQKAYGIASNSIEIADTYGYCLLKSGKTPEALELLELAYKGKQDDSEIALHFVEALLSDNQIKQATEVLSNIVTKDPHLTATKDKFEKQVKLLEQ